MEFSIVYKRFYNIKFFNLLKIVFSFSHCVIFFADPVAELKFKWENEFNLIRSEWELS